MTAKQVEHAPAGYHGDGDGLGLLVKANGRRSWTLKLTVDGKRRTIGLGAHPAVSLAEARQSAAEMRAGARAGDDPVAEARRAAAPTFAEAARAVHELNLPRWRNEQAAREWLSSLERYCFEAFGDRPLDRIRRADVLAVLTPIWTVKPETARRLRQRLRKVFSWGTAYGHLDLNPAGEIIDGALPTQPKVRAHQRALDHSEVRHALKIVDDTAASASATLCLNLLALTATRSGEARGARWSEIDQSAAVWTIPADRMKGGIEHRIPLSPQALDVLAQARKLDNGSGLVFPSPAKPTQPLSWQCLLKLLRENFVETTVHGFRSAFRTWALEQPGVAWAVAEAALAHNLGNAVERAYIRSDLFDARRQLMADWADYIA